MTFKVTQLIVALLVFPVATAWGDAVAKKADEKEQTPEEVASQERLEYMFGAASEYEGIRKSDGAKLKIFGKPLLRFTNPLHGCREGLFVGWVDPNNRPVAVGQVFLMRGTENSWYIETQSLGEGPMTFTSAKNGPWTPTREGVTWTKFEKKAFKPASSKKIRLPQMRKLAQRFAGEDDLSTKANRLRLMSSPMIRYADEKQGVLDGALFAMVEGTDPELLIQVEARKNSQGDYEYWWALAPMTSAKLEAFLDGVSVWTKPQLGGGAQDTFYMRPIAGGVPYPFEK